MAEWLGKGLQNPVQRFNSASDLLCCSVFFVFTQLLLLFKILLSRGDGIGRHERLKISWT